ncbi:MAG: hypothetical protein K2W96_13335 [Gemmataceae bacterium]|nr:hypothetical protein [Gemmataceae bacterium]
MLTRTLAALVLAGLSLGFAPMPFPRPKKKGPATPEEIAARFQGTWKVSSYEYGNRGLGGRVAIPYTEVVIKGDDWTQVRDLRGRKISQAYKISIDASKPVPTMTLGYSAGRGAVSPMYSGVMIFTGDHQVTVTYGSRGREVTDPLGALQLGQTRWVLERAGP